MTLQSRPLLGTSQTLGIESAILLYKVSGSDGSGVLATVHEVGLEKDRPMIMPGRPITSNDIDRLHSRLSNATETMSWLPPNVLSLTASRMVWHVPGKRRRLWFNNEAKTYKHLSGKEVAFPALIFDATINAGLRILALASDARPTPDTPIYRAPFMNLYSLGEMCRGDSPMPKVFSMAAMKRYEASFFDSAFSHTNLHAAAVCRHRKGPIVMWEECRKLARFPAKWLAPLSRAKGNRAHHDDSKVKTVGDLLLPHKWTGHHPL